MRFDVIIGNPPFSLRAEGKMAGKGSRPIYQDFYKLALGWSELVAMIMPTTDRKVQKGHNERLSVTANIIEYIDPTVFRGINMPMWYVISDKSENAFDIDFPLCSPPKNDIEWTKGRVSMSPYKAISGDFGKEEQSEDFPVKIYHKLNSKGMVLKYGKWSHFRKSEFFPSNGYAVLMPQTITDDGWSTVEIVECTGKEVAFNGMNIVFTKTKKDAQDLVSIMETDNFKQQANKVKQGFNNMGCANLRAIRL